MSGGTCGCGASGLTPCGCCASGLESPSLENRPGLPALRYRIGTHSSFLRRMLARLPVYAIASDENQGVRPLQALTGRATDDPSIALLDAWAVTADVLTFYQERIANEGFLGVATERRSVLELARAIGYELSPGVAASTYLAFIVETPIVIPANVVPPERRGFQGAPGNTAPTTAIVPKGTQARSVPGPGETSQTFETSAEIEARLEWNALRPRLTQPQLLDPDAISVVVEGIITGLTAGGRLLFLTPNAVGAIVATRKQVVAVTPDDALQQTRIDLADSTSVPVFTALDRSKLVFSVPTLTPTALEQSSVQTVVGGQTWQNTSLSAFIGLQNWSTSALSLHLAATSLIRATPAAPSFALDPVEPGLFMFSVKAAPFGNNAPRHDTLPKDLTDVGAAFHNDWDTNQPSIAQDSQLAYYLDGGTNNAVAPAHFYFERAVNEVLPASWVIAEAPGLLPKALRVGDVVESSLADFALSGRATGVSVENVDGSDVGVADLSTYKVRKTTLYAGSKSLALAKRSIEDPIGRGTAEEAQLTLDTLALGLTPGQPIAITGERNDLPGVITSEIVIIADAIHSEGLTTLFFQSGMVDSYVRASTTLNANVVAATHGETVVEILGSGSGAIANQRFTLKKPPLTHVSSDDPSGAAAALEIRVNGVLWTERPSLFGVAPDDRAYIVRIDDDAKATVTFGDGIQGARLPTGVANVVATYRSGIGLAGEVDAGTLTVLQVRPLGIREAANPVPAGGAEDPEVLDAARQNAPLTVRTLDRIVSLDDYADFSRGFAGVGKADAVALWNGQNRIIAITIASASGETVSETSALYANLVAAIDAARAPLEPFRVTSFQPLYFSIEVKVLVDAAYETDTVLVGVRNALLDVFSFDRRDFGQPVTAAEVTATIHGVAGVVASDLDALYLVTTLGTAPTLASVLPAAPASWSGSDITLAELLVINPVGITLTEMTP